jgi:hypothetical protein
MAAKIHLNDGLAFLVNEPFEEVERVYHAAAVSRSLFRIRNGSGKVHSVNPASVAFIENVTPVEQAQGVDQAHRVTPTKQAAQTQPVP